MDKRHRMDLDQVADDEFHAGQADPVRRRAHEILIAVHRGQPLDPVLAAGLDQTDPSRDRAFLAELVRRTGCGLLLDVNNVFISAINLGYSPQGYIDAYPLGAVGEIHVGGHDEDHDDKGALLLIDSHGKPVVDPVWALLDYTLARSGPKPVLIEWDNDVPDWPTLEAEAARAAGVHAEVVA